MKALVFLYTGQSIPENLQVAIATNLAKATDAKGIEIFNYDAKDLAKLAVIKSINVEKKDTAMTAEDQAVIYIGTIMANALGEHYKAESFISELVSKLSEARRNPNDESSKQFMNALFILSQEDLNVSKTLLRKYHLDEKKIMIIKRIHNLLC